MGIHWTEELSVGVEEIDNQHRALYRCVDLFFEQVKQRNGAGNLPNLFSFLETYVTAHFSLEEKYMTRFHDADGLGYRDEKEHKAEHRAFLRDFSAFREEFEINGPTAQLIEEFRRWIVNWMAGHLERTDRGLGSFLHSALPFLKRN